MMDDRKAQPLWPCEFPLRIHNCGLLRARLDDQGSVVGRVRERLKVGDNYSALPKACINCAMNKIAKNAAVEQMEAITLLDVIKKKRLVATLCT